MLRTLLLWLYIFLFIFIILILVLLKSTNQFLFHWACSCIWRSCHIPLIWLHFVMLRYLCIQNLLFSIWSVNKQWWPNEISEHCLSIKFYFKWLPLIYHTVQPLTQVLRFKVSSSLWALVLLASIIFSINTFIIVKVDIFFFIIFRPIAVLSRLGLIFIISTLTFIMFFSIILYFILVILFIRKLIEVIFIIRIPILLVVLSILASRHLLCVDSSVLLNFHQLFNNSN